MQHGSCWANWFAFNNPFHDPALALHGLGYVPLGTVFLHIFHGFGFNRFDVHSVCRWRFRDMHRAASQQRTTSSSCRQFRQGHLYRHEQALSLLFEGWLGQRRFRYPALPCHCNRSQHPLSRNRVNHQKWVRHELIWLDYSALGRLVPQWNRSSRKSYACVNLCRQTDRSGESLHLWPHLWAAGSFPDAATPDHSGTAPALCGQSGPVGSGTVRLLLPPYRAVR